ncbi:hypothetical protein KNO35_02550 [Pasteurella multocida]|uniref:hypothetical protein n=1 Tax=Pasteurella multocida TaxID=747 RepID=UPI0007766C19|nr:hypothetical protein [Pasteurella multocida]AMM81531.1 hypothetical protein AW43_03655 [Pasteurella multocida subsp. multocida PMTB2.1]MCT8983680.1 hypothetical protein [Pasteurella multocida]MDT8779455.1 hypothetical protein [Pasteurella multocida]
MKHTNLWNLFGLLLFLIGLAMSFIASKANAEAIDWEAKAKAEWIAEFGDTPRNMTEEEFKYAQKFTLAKQQFTLSTPEEIHKKNR